MVSLTYIERKSRREHCRTFHFRKSSHLWHLHQLFDDISAENIVKHHLKEVIVDDGKFQLVAVPNKDFSLIDSRDGDLEVIVGAHAKVLGRIEKLMGKDDVKRFLVLRYDKSTKRTRELSEIARWGWWPWLTFPITRAINYLLLWFSPAHKSPGS